MTITALRTFLLSLSIAIVFACAGVDADDDISPDPDTPVEHPPAYAGLWYEIPGPTHLYRADDIATFEAHRLALPNWRLFDLEIGGRPGEEREVAGVWRQTETQGESERVHFDLNRTGDLDSWTQPQQMLSNVIFSERSAGYELVDLEVSLDGERVSGVWHHGTDLHTALFGLNWEQVRREVDLRAATQTLVDIETYFVDGEPVYATLWANRVTFGLEVHRASAHNVETMVGSLFDRGMRANDLETYRLKTPVNGSGTTLIDPSGDGGDSGDPELEDIYWLVGIWVQGNGDDWWLHKAKWEVVVQTDNELSVPQINDGPGLSIIDLDLVHMGGPGEIVEPNPMSHDGSTADADL